MASVYVIIVTFNAINWVEQCFSSLRSSSHPVRIIVVDNGSNDGTQEYIKKNFPEAEFVQAPENLGFGKANNLGIEIAYKKGADFFYLMNQDAWLFENSLEKLLEIYKNHPQKEEIGVLSPMHLDGSEQKLDVHFERYLARYTEFNRFLSDVFTNSQKAFYEINFINAAHWLLPKSTIEKIGGFNPYFFQGAEDYDYVNRVKYFGKKILICAESKVVHDTVQSFHKEEPKNKEELLVQTRLSMRMQRETRYLDPHFNFNVKREKIEFYSNILKLSLKGKFDEAKFYKQQYKYFASKFEEIAKAREISKSGNHSYLNI
ncbi:glycosyltransferase family 2 protein [Chryseobacterium sp. SNU WT5]|uniref:glycosyltransferase family 2 protein n=1 Tax=Chryseobacterium sp. SNU WT5 TaxID=2594269 RepID=UPI00117C2DB1|nr:glycosyltransferase family 2 protein [Chryseobacterium sp. SNU WT5]QDP85542.1 glycosyltransferase family 2 protein [Chryseobacterium sp. SNU WT5]